MFGYRDDELNARWVQLGVFSPINRLHSTDNPFNGKEPWKYNKTVEAVMKDFLKLRHGLVPYLYTMNRRASRDNEPLVQPMYYLEPEREEAYQVPNNFYFGTELMVSPVTEKMDPEVLMGKAKTWIPEGVWYDFFSGRRYTGGRMVNLWRSIEEMPVLAREGAVIPLKDMEIFDNSTDNPENMEVRIFPGKEGSFTLWEDEGDTAEDLDENWVSTVMKKEQVQDLDRFVVESPRGNLSVLPEKRSWKFCFFHMKANIVNVLVDGQEVNAQAMWKKEINGMEVVLKDVPVSAKIEVVFQNPVEEYEENLAEVVYPILERAQVSYDLKSKLYGVIEEQGRNAVATLASMNLKESLFGVLCEILTA